MKKLLFFLAGVLVALTAAAGSDSGTKNRNAEVALGAEATRIVERGVSGKQIGGDFGYTYVFCIVMHTDDYGHVISVEPTGKVYRDDRWTGAHDDVTSEVLRESRVVFDPSTWECSFRYSCQIQYGESWEGEGSLILH